MLTLLGEVGSLGVLWIRGDCGACRCVSYRQLYSGEGCIWVPCVMVVEIMGWVCYFACPELVLAEALTSHPHMVGMTLGAPGESVHGP